MIWSSRGEGELRTSLKEHHMRGIKNGKGKYVGELGPS